MSNDIFIPQVGQLVTKVVVGLDGTFTMILLFHDAEDVPEHCISLAFFSKGKTRPYLGKYPLDYGRKTDITQGGLAIVRSLASDENLRLMSQTWDDSNSKHEWIEGVAKIKALSKEELVRIARAFNLPEDF
jgi:hypothetical protein